MEIDNRKIMKLKLAYFNANNTYAGLLYFVSAITLSKFYVQKNYFDKVLKKDPIKFKPPKLKSFLLLLFFFGIFSCGEIIDKPQNLIETNKMSEIIAELAINDQLAMVVPSYNPNEQTKFIFKNLKTDPKKFTESYKYYIAKGKMQKIFENAQKILKDKDPKAPDYINKKLMEKQAEENKSLEKNPKVEH